MICKKGCGTAVERKNMRGGAGAAQLEVLFPELPLNCRLMSIITLNKGCSIGEHEHNGEGELFYVISGAAMHYSNGVPTVLDEGDSVLTYNGRHSIEGLSDEPCRLLAVIIKD